MTHRFSGRAALAMLVTCGGICLHAQPTPSEYQVKAAYLYNFGRFVEWPARNPAPAGEAFTVCVLGDDPFGEALDRVIAGVTINNQSATVKRLAAPEDTPGCRIVFVAASQEKRLGQILTILSNAPMLTVSDMPDFTRRGGMIQFVMEGNRVRFEVNLTATSGAGLAVSSDLLKVASAVRGRSRPGA